MSDQKQQAMQFVRSPFVTTWSIDKQGLLLYIDSEDETADRYIFPVMSIAGIKHGAKTLNGRFQSVVSVLIGTTGVWVDAYKSRANFSTRMGALENAGVAASHLALDLWGDWIESQPVSSENVSQATDNNSQVNEKSKEDVAGKPSQAAKSTSRRTTKQKEASEGD